MGISEDLKNIFLAGIGAVATTAEKSKQIIDELVLKGEITVNQGKILNEELKNNIKSTIQNHNAEIKLTSNSENVLEKLEAMTPDEIEVIKSKILDLESQRK